MSQLSIDTLSNLAGTKTVPTGDLVDGHCTAWVNFNGTTGAIRNSFNVSSVTINAVGDYTITFATPMANANYTVSSHCTAAASTWLYGVQTHSTVLPLVGSIRVVVTSANAGYFSPSDTPAVNLSIFGGK